MEAHLEHLVLQHSEGGALAGPAEPVEGLLALLPLPALPLAVEGLRELRVRPLLHVAVVADEHVVALPLAPSKGWAVATAPEYEVVGGSGHPLFLQVEGKDEDVAVGVRDPAPA